MNEFELWLCVISGESDNERLLYRGDDRMEVDRIINECDDEVTTDPDIMVDKIDFDTQDPEELELAEKRLNELDDTYVDIY